jgi:Ser/Thr protein kinase RdoA (MazF antagonist)
MTDTAVILREGWGSTGEVSALGAGHINDTYLVVDASERWVLQRVNTEVFIDPRSLMHNVERIVSHILSHAPGFVPELIATTDAEPVHVDESGNYWRLSQFMTGTHTLQSLDNADQARAAGRAFARYQNLLADLPEPALTDPIAGFMRLDRYLAEFDEIASAAEPRRRFIVERAPLQNVLQRCDANIHGDCKVNNLLFIDGSDQVGCVVDLDTTMRGHWAWDFGDLVRSGAVDADGFSIDLFAALAEGFVGERSGEVSSAELVVAPRYVCFMLGVRFLTDHLRGDRYFKVSARGENLARAERQFRLLQEMEAAEQEMLQLVSDYG